MDSSNFFIEVNDNIDESLHQALDEVGDDEEMEAMMNCVEKAGISSQH